MDKILKALGDPTRYRIYSSLFENKQCVRSLSRQLKISESAVSQHMNILKEAKLVYGEKYGYHTHYFPKAEGLNQIIDEFVIKKEKLDHLDKDTVLCQCNDRKEKENEE